MNIQIQTTSVCTGNCIICPYPESWHKKNPGRMSDELFQHILHELKPLPVKKICPYLENEPLADPQIFDRIAMIRSMFPNVVIEVSTNALALDEKGAHRLIAALQDGPHDIWFSFHGVDKRSFEGVMGISFEVCLTNIVRFLRLAEEVPLNIRIQGAGLGRDASLNHDFIFSRQEYLQFWDAVFKKNGIQRIPKIHFFTYHDRAGSIHRNGINIARTVRQDLSGFTCTRMSEWLHFLYTGELILCCMDYHRETIFGSMAISELREILQGKPFSTLKDKVTGLHPSEESFICKRCISPGG